MKKLLSFVLALAMVLALVPMGASAESSSTNFTTFAELKELVANAGTDPGQWYYSGSEPLVIEEDMTLPKNKLLSSSAPIVIAKGVTLTVTAYFVVYELTVNGKLVNNGSVDVSGEFIVNGILMNYGDVSVKDVLTVNGSIENSNQLWLYSWATLVNAEKITHVNGGYLCWAYHALDIEHLTEAIEIAAADMSAIYNIDFNLNSQSVVIDLDVDIPQNVELYIANGTCTVPNGSTLTVNGVLDVTDCTLNVDGALVNDGTLMISYTYYGLLNMTGTYSGEGEVYIYSHEEKIDVETAAPGLDVSYFPHVYEESWGWWMTHNDYSGGGSSSSTEFVSFDELKELVANARSDWAEWHYVGAEPLVIAEDLTIPQNKHLYFDNAAMVVAEGATLTVESGIFVEELTVNGKLVNNSSVDVDGELAVNGMLINNGNLYVFDVLTVNGTIDNSNQLQLSSQCTLVNAEKITYINGGYLSWYYFTQDVAQLTAAIEVAAADMSAIYQIVFEAMGQAVGLDLNMDIPENTKLILVNGTFTTPSGSTLTVNGDLWLYGTLDVEGAMVNNGYVYVEYAYNGLLNMTGTYSGTGEIWVYVADADVDLSTAVPGIDISNAAFVATQGGYLIPGTEEEHTHDWGEGVITTPATCTMEGVLTYTCECGETKTEAIPATGHSFGEWVTVTEPTEEAEGKAERKCQNCEEVETKVLDKLESGLPKLGDVNNDGRLSAKDATMILRWVVRKLTDVPTHFEQVADVNDDGKISAKDATMILRFVVGKGDIPGWER